MCNRLQKHCDCGTRLEQLEESVRQEMAEMHETVNELIRVYKRGCERRQYDLLKMIFGHCSLKTRPSAMPPPFPILLAPTQPTTVAEPGAVLAVDSLLDEDWVSIVNYEVKVGLRGEAS